MLNVGGGELLIILLVALIFLGPSRLPEVARQVGQTVSMLRGLARGFQAELEAAARPDPLKSRTAELAEKARTTGGGDPDNVRPVDAGGPGDFAVPADDEGDDGAEDSVDADLSGPGAEEE